MERPISPEHMLDLEKSGLDIETIKTSGVYSVVPGDIGTILGRNVNGIRSLLAIPYPGTDFTRYKLFPPCKFSAKDDKPRKYFQTPGSPIHLYKPPGFDPYSEVIRITEGEKKALKGTQEGLNVCGLGGIWNFANKDDNENPVLIAALKNVSWAGKKVELIPDGDFQRNPSVCHAIYRLGSLLQDEGAKVSIVRLPADKKLDDFLPSHSPEAFCELDLLSLDHPIFRQAQVADHGLITAIRSAALNLDDFRNIKIPERPYLLRPILQPGTLGMIYSPRGWGKTMFASAVAIAVTHGVPIGKWHVESPAGCLYIDGEMPVKDLQQRIRDLTRGLSSPDVPLAILSSEWLARESWPRPNLLSKEWRDALYTFLSEGKHQVLILDNKAALSPGIDENSSQDWSEVNQWLLSLRFLGVAVIIIHHAGRSGEPRGTTGLEDSLDFIIKLSHPKGYREEDGCDVDVSFTKARSIFGKDAAPFNFKILRQPNGGLTWTTADAEGGLKNLIIAMFGNGYTANKISGDVGKSPSYIHRIKREAVEAGYLERDPGNKNAYAFTEHGRIEFGGVRIE